MFELGLALQQVWAEKYSPLGTVQFVFLALEPDTFADLQAVIPLLGGPDPGLASITYPIVFRQDDDWQQYVSEYFIHSVPDKGLSAVPRSLGLVIIDPSGKIADVRTYPGYQYAGYDTEAELAWVTETIDHLLAGSMGLVSGSIALQNPDGSLGARQPGAMLQFINQNGSQRSQATADDNGNYQVRLLPGGYVVTAVDSAGVDWGPGPGLVTVSSSQPTSHDILLGPGWLTEGNVGGTVTEQPSGPVSPSIGSAAVTFTSTGGNVKSATTGLAGQYRIPLEPGSYWLFASHPDYADYYTYPNTVLVTAEGPQTRNITLRRIIGSSAPDATWQMAWEHGAAAESGRSLSLSSLSGKVVAMLLATSAPGAGGG